MRPLLLALLLTSLHCGDMTTAALPAHCEYLDPTGADRKFVACKGTFSAGGAGKLCPAGYEWTTAPLPPSLRSACIMNFAWINARRFFVTSIPLWAGAGNPPPLSCTMQAGYTAALAGCGAVPVNGTSVTYVTNSTCQGWPSGILCTNTKEWRCDAPASASSTDANGGVICSLP